MISKQQQKKLEASEIWVLKKMLQISWKAKKSNERVFRGTEAARSSINKIYCWAIFFLLAIDKLQ